MKAVATAISENVARAAPRQLMLFATSWSPLIGVFRDKFMTDAATVITSKIEASLVSNVKQVIIPLFLISAVFSCGKLCSNIMFQTVFTILFLILFSF